MFLWHSKSKKDVILPKRFKKGLRGRYVVKSIWISYSLTEILSMGSHNYKFCRDAPLHNYPLLRCEKTQISRPARIQKLFVCIKISFRFFSLLPNLIFSLKSFSWISFSIFLKSNILPAVWKMLQTDLKNSISLWRIQTLLTLT